MNRYQRTSVRTGTCQRPTDGSNIMVMRRLSSKLSSRRGLSLPAVVAMLAVLGAVVFACLAMTQPADTAPRGVAAPTGESSPGQVAPIEQVRLGQRVLGRNPEMTDADRAAVEPVDPATWGAVTLRLTKPDGTTLTVELLRPQAWLESHDAAVGATIYLDMPELGAVGGAEVLAVGPCPAIAAGTGPIVTGRFAHTAGAVLDVRFDDAPDPIGVTASHPFYSADRNAFIPAGELAPGERITTLTGVARIASITPRGPPEPVYNLEVHGEHVYHVGALGALAHNMCAKAGNGGFLDADEFRTLSRNGNIDPSRIRFSQDSIARNFKPPYGSVDDLAMRLRGGLSPSTIAPIRIVERRGKIFTLDNRRLYAFQQAGVSVPFHRLDAVPRRELRKFTTNNNGTSIFVRGSAN